MDVRYSTDPQGFQKMSTEELRKTFLISNLFMPDEVPMTYSDIDRSITGSAVPVNNTLKLLGTKKEMAAEYFCERREVGVINIGGSGHITVDGKEVHDGVERRPVHRARGQGSNIFQQYRRRHLQNSILSVIRRIKSMQPFMQHWRKQNMHTSEIRKTQIKESSTV